MIRITIKTDNEAFQDGNRRYETARILRDIADRMERNYTPNVNDINGNRCGSVTLTGKDQG